MTTSLILFAGLAVAAELDCDGLDAASCATANHLANLANAHVGETLFDAEAPVGRYTTRSVYRKIRPLRDAAVDGACSVDGVMAGNYAGRSTFDGQLQSTDLADFAFISGSQDVRIPVLGGTYIGPGGSGTIGDIWGQPIRGGRLAANVDDAQGYLVGFFVRNQGLEGVWLGIYGSCAGDAADVFGASFDTPIGPVTYDEVFPYMQADCSTCHRPFPEGGLGVAPLIGAIDILDSFDATQDDCLFGTTCGELMVTHINTDVKPIPPEQPYSDATKVLFTQWVGGGMQPPID